MTTTSPRLCGSAISLFMPHYVFAPLCKNMHSCSTELMRLLHAWHSPTRTYTFPSPTHWRARWKHARCFFSFERALIQGMTNAKQHFLASQSQCNLLLSNGIHLISQILQCTKVIFFYGFLPMPVHLWAWTAFSPARLAQRWLSVRFENEKDYSGIVRSEIYCCLQRNEGFSYRGCSRNRASLAAFICGSLR